MVRFGFTSCTGKQNVIVGAHLSVWQSFHWWNSVYLVGSAVAQLVKLLRLVLHSTSSLGHLLPLLSLTALICSWYLWDHDYFSCMPLSIVSFVSLWWEGAGFFQNMI
jgi:hypothetical protein